MRRIYLMISIVLLTTVALAACGKGDDTEIPELNNNDDGVEANETNSNNNSGENNTNNEMNLDEEENNENNEYDDKPEEEDKTREHKINDGEEAEELLEEELGIDDDDTEVINIGGAKGSDEKGEFYKVTLRSKSDMEMGGSGWLGLYKVYKDGEYEDINED